MSIRRDWTRRRHRRADFAVMHNSLLRQRCDCDNVRPPPEEERAQRRFSKMTRIAAFALVSGLCVLAEGYAYAQQAPMSFFVTSVGLGKGGDLGGLAGADRHCQSLAQAVGAGSKTWRAYLSTQGSGGV